jgi:hypothetical protein
MKIHLVDQLNNETSALLNSNNVVVIDNALHEDACKDLVMDFDRHQHKKTNIVSDFGAISFEELNLSVTPGFEKWHNLLIDHGQYYEEIYKSTLKVPEYSWPASHGFEQFRMKRYDNNDYDRFDPHVDVRDYASARRFLVFFWYLNDVEESGETAFYFGDREIRVKPKAGRLIMFPPMWTHAHAGLRPISGPKYIAGGYLHYV